MQGQEAMQRKKLVYGQKIALVVGKTKKKQAPFGVNFKKDSYITRNKRIENS